MSDVVGISSSAIAAYQRALTTVSNNIANMSTEGYSRQTVNLQDNAPEQLAKSFMGTGVVLAGIKRQFDAFAEANLQTSTSDLNAQEPVVEYAKRLMDIMGDKLVGLSSAFDTFFTSAQSLAADPGSSVMRTGFLTSAQGMSARFAELAGQMTGITDEVHKALENAANQMNTYTSQLALVNQQLAKIPVIQNQPAQLLDQRDQLLRDMSELSRIKISYTANGIASVSLGSTMSDGLLVDGLRSYTIGFNPQNPSSNDLVRDPYGSSDSLAAASGGTIGGLNAFMSGALEPAQKSLDMLANLFVNETNAIQRNGIDGYGQMGTDLFVVDPEAESAASAVKVILTDGMRIATGALFRVIEQSTNTAGAKAVVEFANPEKPLAVSNANLVNNPNPAAGVAVNVPADSMYAKVTDVAAGLNSPVFFLDSAQPGQQLQVMTRDGRHLAGKTLTLDERFQMIKPENGFNTPMTYSDAYLNKAGEEGYMDVGFFYGAQAKVMYAQNFDSLGNVAEPTPLPATLESGRLPTGQTGTVIQAGTVTLNGQALGDLTASGPYLLATDIADWINSLGSGDLQSVGFPSQDTPIHANTPFNLELTLDGQTQTIFVPQASSGYIYPEDVMRAINSASLGINAKLVNKGSQANPDYRLLIFGRATQNFSLNAVSASTEAEVTVTQGGASTTESADILFGDLYAGDSVTVAGLTLLASSNLTAAQVAAAFANLTPVADGGTQPADVPGQYRFSGTLTGYSTAAAASGAQLDQLVWTSTTANSDVTDLTADLTRAVVRFDDAKSLPTALDFSADENFVSDIRATAFNNISVPKDNIDLSAALSINGVSIQGQPFRDIKSLLTAINSVSSQSQVKAGLDSIGNVILQNASGHEGENITIGPAGAAAANALAIKPMEYGGMVRIVRQLGSNLEQSNVELSFGDLGTPFDLAKAGFRTGVYINGDVPDEVMVFVTGPGQAKVAAGYKGEPTDVQTKLREQSLEIRFLSDNRYAITELGTGTELAVRTWDTKQLEPTITYQGLTLTLNHAPNVGDVFVIDGNHDGIGNNQNMLAMADLAKKQISPGKTIGDLYTDQVNKVGNIQQQATITQQALAVVHDQAVQARDKVSGVSLDNEATDLIRFQQAYQAAAKALQTATQLFDTIVQLR
ncbi:MAG: Flagellar hook-associated protein 1 [Pseudomonadota bacterium]